MNKRVHYAAMADAIGTTIACIAKCPAEEREQRLKEPRVRKWGDPTAGIAAVRDVVTCAECIAQCEEWAR